MIVLPENRLLLDKDKHPTASVFVRVRGNTQLQPSVHQFHPLSRRQFRRGFEARTHVTVVDNLGNVLSENTDDDSIAGLTSIAARRAAQPRTIPRQKRRRTCSKKSSAPARPSSASPPKSITTPSHAHRGKIRPGRPGHPHADQERREQRLHHDQLDRSPAGISANTSTGTNSTQDRRRAGQQFAKSQDHFHRRIRNRQDHQQHHAGRRRHQTAFRRRHRRRADAKARAPTAKSSIARRRNWTSSADHRSPWRRRRGHHARRHHHAGGTAVQRPVRHRRHPANWTCSNSTISGGTSRATSAYPALGLVALLMLLRLFKRTPVQEIPIGVPVGRLLGHAQRQRKWQWQRQWQRQRPSAIAV